ncbi:glycosyltransferase [Rhypophila decipiens]|uniref:Glycosyltransferase n=1 Tax=Rhypophila decipiens TaxID=261697 RepID=A0AAN7B8Q1_9PEZI|nr:glycosyltransferase [Rhypophila decipiens]
MTTSTLETSSDKKPIILAAGFPASGHSKNLVHVANHLSRRGFTVYCITADEFKSSLKQNGVSFIHHPFPWQGRDVPPADDPTMVGGKAFAYAFKRAFIDSTPTAHRLINSTLERLHVEHPTRKIVILHEICFMGLMPYLYGAPLPKGYSSLPPILSVHTSIDARTDFEVPPFGPGLPYDPTPENLALWRSIYASMEPIATDMNDYLNATLKSLGATRDVSGFGFLLDALFDIGKTTFLFTTHSTDYPPRRKPSKLRYIGGLPVPPVSTSLALPDWWDSVLLPNSELASSSPDKKRVVFVTQGTVHLNYDDLIIPSLKAFASRKDLIVIAVLGVKGAKLTSPSDPGFPKSLPSNAYILQSFPYDAILPHADVFITNGGYNGYMHGIMNGVPMIMAGMDADKGEVSARAEYAGIAVNLKTQRATEEMLLGAVDKILGDKRFKEKVMALKADNEACDPLGDVEKSVLEEGAVNGHSNGHS